LTALGAANGLRGRDASDWFMGDLQGGTANIFISVKLQNFEPPAPPVARPVTTAARARRAPPRIIASAASPPA
jgi:hypothetical protein